MKLLASAGTLLTASAVLFLALPFSSVSGAVGADTERTFSGAVYETLEQKKKLFTFEGFARKKGDEILLRFTYRDSEGKPVIMEEALVDTEGDPERYIFDQYQLGERGVARVQDGELHFSYGRKGKEKTDQEKRKGNLVFGPSLVYYVQQNWPKLSQGRKIDIQFGVIDRRETIGFELGKKAETNWKGKPATTIEMKPSSPILRPFVTPTRLTFARDGSRLYFIEGLMPMRVRRDGKWKELEAALVLDQ